MAFKWLAGAALLIAGCASGTVTGARSDAAPAGADAAPIPDAPLVLDGPLPDARPDAPLPADAAPPDAGFPDAARPDAAPPDAAGKDARLVDAFPSDARRVDAATLDAGAPDAAPPDAPRADAACRVDLLANGDFDSTTGTGDNKDTSPWVNVQAKAERPYLVATAAELAAAGFAPQSGGYAAWLGGENDAENGLYVTVVVPAGTRKLTLYGQFRVRTNEATETLEDFLELNLSDQQGHPVAQFGVLSEADRSSDWVAREFSLANPHAGETLTFWLWATTDASIPTDFLVDSLRLEAQLCE